MSKNNIIKEYLNNIKNQFLISEIWDEVKKYIKDLGSGEITEVLKRDKKTSLTCKSSFPVGYSANENIERTFVVRTSTNDVYTIKLVNYGLNYETDCNMSEYSIYDINGELLYKSNINNKSKKMSI